MSAFHPILDRARVDRVRHGALLVVAEPALFGVAGPGALQCLQGLLTNDLVKPGDDSLVYGALLTPKGMIVVDYWVIRRAGEFLMIAPSIGRTPSLELFRRSLPPRLARVTDLTEERRAAWLVGAEGFHALVKSGIGPIPESCGRVSTVATDAGPVTLALGSEVAPFTACLVGEPAAINWVCERLAAAGVGEGTASDLAAARILAGWPALGAEIDARTLPQEVRYDQIGGVSYTKGCYTGQETVARLHFRGHTNRELRGLRWNGAAPLDGTSIVQGDREVGTVRSTLQFDDRILGLAPIRREVATGDTVIAGGRAATVVALPFGPDEIDS